MAVVLIVDDEVAIADMLAEIVIECGHTAVTAQNGQQGLAQARLHLPMLILCDVMMPIMNGHALLRALRGNPVFKRTQVYLMSAAPLPKLVEPGDVAPEGYLAKPFDLAYIELLLEKLP